MVNKVILLGSVGKDAELKGEGDRSVLSINLATDEGYFDKDNKWVQATEWHSIRVFGKNAFRRAEIKKGFKIYVEGRIKSTQKKDSAERYYQIVADKIKIISKPDSAPAVVAAQRKSSHDSFDDDIPF